MNYEYRQYQEDAVNDCLRSFEEQKNKSVMLESPVGSGKTLMALQVICRLQGRHASHAADFFQEASRIGLLENGTAAGSLAEKFIQEAVRQFPGLSEDLEGLRNTPVVQPRSGDVVFFTDYHAHDGIQK